MITPVPSPLVAGFVAGGGAPAPTPTPTSFEAVARAEETGGGPLPAGTVRFYRTGSTMFFAPTSINGFTLSASGLSFASDDTGITNGGSAFGDRLRGRVLVAADGEIIIGTPDNGDYLLELWLGQSVPAGTNDDTRFRIWRRLTNDVILAHPATARPLAGGLVRTAAGAMSATAPTDFDPATFNGGGGITIPVVDLGFRIKLLGVSSLPVNGIRVTKQ